MRRRKYGPGLRTANQIRSVREITSTTSSAKAKACVQSTGAKTCVVSAIVISYNTAQLTRSCLIALQQSIDLESAEVIVVDNNSKDESVAMIRMEFPYVRVIENKRNLGFGAANNLAMAAATGEFFLLVNSDAVVGEGAVERMIEMMQEQPKAGAVVPQLLNADGTLQRSVWRYPSPLRIWADAFWLPKLFPENAVLGDFRSWAHDAKQKVEWAIGACLMVRRSVFEEIGGFDERFFMYAEETDWQKCMTAAGWEVWLTPDAKVIHLGGGSGKGYATVTEQFYHSQDLYLLKHYGWAGLIAARLAIFIGSFARAFIWLFCRASIDGSVEDYNKNRRHRCWLGWRAASRWKSIFRAREHWTDDSGRQTTRKARCFTL